MIARLVSVPPHRNTTTNPWRIWRVAAALTLVAVVVAALLSAGDAAAAAPVPVPTPSGSVSAVCTDKAPGQVAWCMPWAVHVDSPPAGARSHWVTDCTKAIGDAVRQACRSASVTLAGTPKVGTPSVLMDGPSVNGLAALVNCGLLTAAGSSGQTSPWTDKQAACRENAARWAAQSYDPRPTVACGTVDVPCQVSKGAQQAVGSGIRSGVEGLVDLCVQGLVVLLSKLAGIVFSTTAIAAPDEAFYFTYNAVAGVLVLLIFVLFIVSTIINGLRVGAGPGPLSTLGGLMRAILGVTFAGGIAYTMVAAWDQATIALLKYNATTAFTGREWENAFTKLAGEPSTLFIALILSLLALLGLLPLFVMMLFRGVLATGAALFGAWAMAGQAMSETRHWGRRWFWTVNALASSKFAIAALWVYGSRAGYESDLWTGLKAVLLIWLMVFAPYILLRLTAMVDGYLSDVNAHSLVPLTAPITASHMFATGVGNGWRANAPPDGSDGGSDDGADGPGSGAASVMSANSAATPTTPGGMDGEVLGDDGPNSAAADAAGTGADGGKVGDPIAATGGEHADAGSANADEADGVEQGLRSARHDVTSGELTTPGDTTGADGSVPVMPHPGQTPSNPAGGGAPPSSGSAPDGGASAGGNSGDRPGGAEEPGAAGGASRGASAVADVPIVPL